MKNCITLLLACISFFCFILQESRACSTFQLRHEGRVFVGKNYDWMVEDGLIIVNKRGVSKTAMPAIGANSGVGRPASWTSKYGSITFNQYGREAPIGGMNEAGLVVESMGLFRNKKFPTPDSRPSITMQQWMQYQLDNSASVKEIIASDSKLRIRPKKGVHIHFLVSDKEGNCATIEFIGGKLVCHTNETMPYKLLTNTTYAESVEFLKLDKIPAPDRFRSIERFIRGAKMVKSYKPGVSKPPLEYSFDILKALSWSVKRKWRGKTWTSNTKWSIVYDAVDLQIYFRTFDNRKIRSINLSSFDFSCAAPVKILDINAELSGDVTKEFVDYTQQANRNLIENAYNKTHYLPKFPDEKFDARSKYPDATVCGN